MQWKHGLQICLIILKYNEIALLWEGDRIWTSPFIPFRGFTSYQKDNGQAEGKLGLAWTWAPHHPITWNSPLPKPHQTNIQSKSKPYACYAKAAWRRLRTRLWSQGPPKQKSWCCLCKSGAVFIVHICPSEELSAQSRWPGQESTSLSSLARIHSKDMRQTGHKQDWAPSGYKAEGHRGLFPSGLQFECLPSGVTQQVCYTAQFLELAEAPWGKGTDPIPRSRGPQITCIFDKLATSFRKSLDLLSFDNSLEQLVKLKKALYLWLKFYYERYKPEPAKWRRTGCGLGLCPTQSFCAFSLVARHVFTNQESHWALVGRVSTGVSIHRHDWFESSASWLDPELPLGKAGSNAWLLFLVTSPHPESSH